MICSIAEGLCEWWPSAWEGDAPLTLRLEWRNELSLTLGQLRPASGLFRYKPDPAKFTTGAERTGRLLGKAFTRAGWLRPMVDPAALVRLASLRTARSRVEFVLETTALTEGVGHWLVDLFADVCDVVVTAVTLRELQDAYDQAGFSESLRHKADGTSKESKKRSDMLGKRQQYLAANRFRERTGYPRVLWRELAQDDAALLLSRGSTAAGNKSSEADTLLLRSVRRSIHDRVDGLERFFVVGDTALARRATKELPAGSVIAARVGEPRPERVLVPLSWWPGNNEGCAVQRHPARLVWELLCIGDAVVLEDTERRQWRFSAFRDPMWPSDYRNPWVKVEEPAPSAKSVRMVPAPEAKASAQEAAEAVDAAPPRPSIIWPSSSAQVDAFDRNLRLNAQAVLDVLAALVRGGGAAVPLPAVISEQKTQLKNAYRPFFETLELAELDLEKRTVAPGARFPLLREAWGADDLDGVFDLLRPWRPLEEWATLDEPPSRPDLTAGTARRLVSLLGQGVWLDRSTWRPGGRRPSVDEIREAVLEAVEGKQRALTVNALLVDVFLRHLGVAPARVVRHWSRLWEAGVFEGFEPREGGSSSGKLVQEVARLGEDGWTRRTVDLESVAGVRDMLYKKAT